MIGDKELIGRTGSEERPWSEIRADQKAIEDRFAHLTSTLDPTDENIQIVLGVYGERAKLVEEEYRRPREMPSNVVTLLKMFRGEPFKVAMLERGGFFFRIATVSNPFDRDESGKELPGPLLKGLQGKLLQKSIQFCETIIAKVSEKCKEQ